MPSLMDPPSGAEMDLIDIIGNLMLGGNGQLPTTVAVALHLEDRGHNGDEVIRGARQWGASKYRSIYERQDYMADKNRTIARLGLTIYGIYHANTHDGEGLIAAFLQTLGVACENQVLQRRTSAYELLELKLPVERVMHSISSLDLDGVSNILQHEPTTWRFDLSHDKTYWDTTYARLLPFRGVNTVDGYLLKLSEMLESELEPPAVADLPPMALPEALDHLGLAWFITTGSWLVEPRRASNIATLTQSAYSADEFAARCSALKTILDRFAVPDSASTPSGAKSMVKLRAYFSDNHPATAAASDPAVSTLQSIGQIRDADQHEGSKLVTSATRARISLGLPRFGDDWYSQWNVVRTKAVEAFGTLREILVESLP